MSAATKLVLEAIRPATPDELAELRGLLALPRAGYESAALLLTVEDAAARANCSSETIRRACRSGRLRASRIGSQWRVSPEALAEWLTAPRPENRRADRVASRHPRSRAASRALLALTEW
jgi:excisionase family DNA binding protein